VPIFPLSLSRFPSVIMNTEQVAAVFSRAGGGSGGGGGGAHRRHLLPPLHAGRVRGSPPTLVCGASAERAKYRPVQVPVLYRSLAHVRPLSPPGQSPVQCCPASVAAHFRMRSHMPPVPPPSVTCLHVPSNPRSGWGSAFFERGRISAAPLQPHELFMCQVQAAYNSCA